MDEMQMRSAGSKVVFRSLLSLKYPEIVIVPSAITRARVPASVDSNPPLKVPRESLDDIIFVRSERFTPGLIEQKKKTLAHSRSKFQLQSLA